MPPLDVAQEEIRGKDPASGLIVNEERRAIKPYICGFVPQKK